MIVELVGTGAIYTKYNSACTLINEDMIIDMPNGTVKQLLKEKHELEKIKTIVITHLHGDHTADIPFFLKYVYNFSKIKNEIVIIGPRGTEKQIIKLFESYRFEDKKEIEHSMKIKYIELEQKNTIISNINGYKVQSILVSHAEEKPAYGYVINDAIGLTGDSEICNGVEEIVKNSKITIADTSLFEGNIYHMGIDNIKYLVEKYKKQIIPTHLRDTTREKLNSEDMNNVLVVEDGYTFEIMC